MKVLPDAPQELCVTYWGSDGGTRAFDILVDGAKIATERLNARQPEKFYDEVYAIPRDLTKGKSKVTVRFQAAAGQYGRRRFSMPGLEEGAELGSRDWLDHQQVARFAGHGRQNGDCAMRILPGIA